MSIALEELVRYWQGELPSEREAEVEEVLFADAETARRLDALASLDTALRVLIRSGKLQSGLTVGALAGLERAGLSLRVYGMEPGMTVPCTIAAEDLVVLRFRCELAGAERVDIGMEGVLDGVGPVQEQLDEVVVDREAGEVVLVYPGERIRALPRSQFRYRVSSGSRLLGEFGLDHSPPR